MKKITHKNSSSIFKVIMWIGYKLSSTIRFSFGIIILFSILFFEITYFGQGYFGLNLKAGATTIGDKICHSMYHSIVTFATLGYGDTLGLDLGYKILIRNRIFNRCLLNVNNRLYANKKVFKFSMMTA